MRWLLASSALSLVACGGLIGLDEKVLVSADTGVDAAIDSMVESGDTGSTDAPVADVGCGDLASDKNNCGSCGHKCVDGDCVGSVCQPLAFASLLTEPEQLATDGTSLYWTEGGNEAAGSVQRCALAGCSPSSLWTDSTPTIPWAIAFGDKELYWSTYFTGAVRHCTTPACTATTLATEERALGIALTSEYVYWTSQGAGTVRRCPRGMSCSTPLVVASGQTNAWGIVADSDSVYWAGGGNIAKCDHASTGAACDMGMSQTLVMGQGGASVLVADATDLYWVIQVLSPGISKVMAAKKDGTNVRELLRSDNGIWSIAVDDEFIYIGSQGPGAAPRDHVTGRIERCPKSTGCGSTPPTVLAKDQKVLRGMLLHAGKLYWATGSAIMRLSL